MKSPHKILTTRFRRVGGASCSIRMCGALPKEMQTGSREIYELWTDRGQRRRGFATTLMHSICRDADEARILLIVIPKVYDFESDAMDQESLEAWYTCVFGFQLIQKELVRIMARVPGATPKTHLRLTPMTKAVIESVR